MNCKYCKVTHQGGERCFNCGAPAGSSGNSNDYISKMVKRSSYSYNEEVRVKMAARLQDNHCPIDDCGQDLVHDVESYLSECGGGHHFRKEDLFYLRPVTGVLV